VFGTAIVVLVVAITPKSHQSLSFVFTERINNSGFGDIHGGKFWFFALPLGFLLTQYTITGYDASAHLSEETQGAANGAARGIWQSILYSAIGGWILLLAFLFAATKVDYINSFDTTVNPYGGGSIIALLDSALTPGMLKLVIFISMSGQIYCSTACMTSTSRMMFAFSRDGAVPGSRLWSKVNINGTPRNAVLLSAVAALVLTLPAIYKSPTGAPTAFLAVVSIGVIGLYLAFAIPIWYRWKAGDAWTPGPWTLGSKYKWMSLLAVGEIAVTSVYFILPFGPAGTPWSDSFTWTAVNYAPIVMVVLLGALWIAWHVSVKHWFTGPKINVTPPPPETTSV
jgi:amino acid transporter